MHKARRVGARSFALCLLALPGLAFAHPGPHHVADMWAGLLHPLTGFDHLLAMIAVGLWAAQLGRTAMWVLPAAFPAAMLLGAGFGLAGVDLPLIEPMIAVSVMLLGVAVASGLRLPIAMSAVLIAFFAVFHGYAHAIEAPAGGTFAGYATGFIVVTMLLHVLGVRIGMSLARANQPLGRQIGGSLVALAGAALLVF